MGNQAVRRDYGSLLLKAWRLDGCCCKGVPVACALASGDYCGLALMASIAEAPAACQVSSKAKAAAGRRPISVEIAVMT